MIDAQAGEAAVLTPSLAFLKKSLFSVGHMGFGHLEGTQLATQGSSQIGPS